MKAFYFLIFYLYLSIGLFAQNKNRLNVQEFFQNPFQSDITIPKILSPYNSFEELYDTIGIPINKTLLKIHKSYNMGEHTYDFQYEYYNIGIVYAESKDIIYISYIWITLREDVDYTFNVKKNYNLESIEEIFGRTNQINNFNNGISEYCYYYDNLFGELKFQFDNGFLKSIIIWCWD